MDSEDPHIEDGSGEEQVVNGEVIDTRTLPEQESEFRRATENTLEFRNLEGGEYKLVKVDEDRSE